MVPDRQKVRTDGRKEGMDGRKEGMDGRTDDAKTISLRLRRGIKKSIRGDSAIPDLRSYMLTYVILFV